MTTTLVNEITLTLPYPPRQLSPNYRPRHWSEVSRAKRDYRAACKVEALQVRNTQPGIKYPLAAPVAAHVVFVIAKGPLPDADNALAAIKAGIDGIVDSKLLRDDADILEIRTAVVRGDKGHPSIVSIVLRGAL